MKERVAYYDSVDLRNADQKAVKKMFIRPADRCEIGAPAAATELRGEVS